ncbi:uncharacterized protein N7458_008726 [Penicillium daleae]|uniref:Uncharacterized protein n=1 Tax=Penicillium daleae TaxID=63821 RepID=A0AAD6C4B0_9EURO|nr:uncharacterized protein N7458_008726 [Penicillium daleae]KAJ5444854.1 hypothetical protein N7458_008726 [Penicillium daleae]
MKARTLVCLLLAAVRASAVGYISCQDESMTAAGGEGWTGNIPTHNVVYSFDDNNFFYCAGIPGPCADEPGDDKDYYTCEGDYGSERAAFWITGDGCYNIRSGGNHMYCCGADQNGGGHCAPTGFGPGKI